MELFSTLSDDQIALLGCATALVATGTLMSLSYFLGRGRMGSAKMLPRQSAASSGLAEIATASADENAKRRSAA
jgi:hypothetical protein